MEDHALWEAVVREFQYEYRMMIRAIGCEIWGIHHLSLKKIPLGTIQKLNNPFLDSLDLPPPPKKNRGFLNKYFNRIFENTFAFYATICKLL